MKQIKVYITPEQWAEKRLQLLIDWNNDATNDELDSFIEKCGFSLLEEPWVDDIYRELFNHLQKHYGIVALESEIGEIVHLCRPILEVWDKDEKKEESSKENDLVAEIPTDEVEAVKYFLNQLPDGYRERALSQMSENFIAAMLRPKDMKDAIVAFNRWSKTKEGEHFWDKVFRHYKSIVPLPPLPSK